MTSNNLERRARALDARVAGFMTHWSIPVLSFALGVVYVWFGALKLVPGLSPAEDLVLATVPFLPASVFMPFLGVWEIVLDSGSSPERPFA